MTIWIAEQVGHDANGAECIAPTREELITRLKATYPVPPNAVTWETDPKYPNTVNARFEDVPGLSSKGEIVYGLYEWDLETGKQL